MAWDCCGGIGDSDCERGGNVKLERRDIDSFPIGAHVPLIGVG